MPLTRNEFEVIVRLFYHQNQNWNHSFTRFVDDDEIWSVCIDNHADHDDAVLLSVIYECGKTIYTGMMSRKGDFCVGIQTGNTIIYF